MEDVDNDKLRPLTTRIPDIRSDGGPCTTHNQACAVHHYDAEISAVLNMNAGVFEPSWKAQREGWMLIKAPKSGLIRKILKVFQQ